MENNDMRADAALAARGLVSSREKARELILAGLVTANGLAVDKPSRRVKQADLLEIHGRTHPYVSRGGLKLEKALKVFRVDPKGAVCVDIGASTGGFTDVLLQNGAARVYAVDVGSGQLDAGLAADPRVVSMEHVNARALDAAMFPQRPTLGVMDVSFISIRLILPAALSVLGPEGRMVCLVKPQFEAGRQQIGKRGIVSNPQTHRRVLKDIVDFAPTLSWRVNAMDFSPITGGDGNLEFLADLVPEARCESAIGLREIEAVVERAHSARL